MLTAVLLSLLVTPALQGVSAVRSDTAAEPPVRVWLNNDNRFEPGDRARVHVRVSDDGYLVVLHADPGGRLRVLFPLDPGDDNFVRGREELEVRGRGDRDAFAVTASGGTGVVYAALSPDPFRFDPFVRGDHWDYRVLADSGITRDPEAALTDIVQRMTSDGRFDYDLVTYQITDAVADAREEMSRDWNDSRRYGGGSSLWWDRWNDPWYDPFYSSFYGSSFGLRLHFGAPWGRFHVFSGHRHPFYYDPFFYDPFFYDPFYRYGYYGPFYYDPFWYGYGYGRPWGFRRPITYVYVNRPYDRYRFKSPRAPLGGGIKYRDRPAMAGRLARRGSLPIQSRPRNEIEDVTRRRRTIDTKSLIGSRDRRLTPSDRGSIRSPRHGVIDTRDRRPVGSDDRLTRRRLTPVPSTRPAPSTRPTPRPDVRPTRDRIEPRRAEPATQREPTPSSVDRRGSSGGGGWSRPSSPRSDGYSRPSGGDARPSSGGYARPSGGYSRPSGSGYARPSGGGYRRP